MTLQLGVALEGSGVEVVVSKPLSWLSNEAWSVIDPHLPQNQSGARRVDDRRLIAGIIHMLALWQTLAGLPGRVRALHHHLQSLEPLEWPMHLGSHRRCADRRRPHRRGGPTRQQLRESPPLGRWPKRGPKAHAIGVSRGGRTTKIHAVCDLFGRRIALALTPGNTSDIKAVPALIAAAGRLKHLIVDRG